jgi:hypothetical protein
MNDVKDAKGNIWKPYIMCYESEGHGFGSVFYAISREHAELVLQDIKDTAFLAGEVRKRPAEDDSSAL